MLTKIFKPKCYTPIIILSISIILLSCDTAHDPVNGPVSEWESLGFEDKEIMRMKLYGSYLYVGTHHHGLWRLNIETGDLNWEHLGPDFTEYSGGERLQGIDVYNGVITVGFRNPVRIDEDTRTGIWRSYDDGKTWEPADSGIKSWSASFDIIRSPYNPEIMLAGKTPRLFRSVDGGLSWTKIGRDPIILNLRFTWHPSEPDYVFWHGEGPWGAFLIISFDKGITSEWAPAIGGRLSSLNYIAFDAEDNDIMYFSIGRNGLYKTEKGLDYLINPVEYPELIIDGRADAVVTHPSQPGVFFAGCGFLCLSDDYGSTIYKESFPDLDRGVIRELVYDESSNTLYASWSKGGIYLLHDPFNAELTLYGIE